MTNYYSGWIHFKTSTRKQSFVLSASWSAQRDQETRFGLAFCTTISRSSFRKQRMIRSLVPSAHLAVFKASVQFSSQSRSFQSAEIGCVVQARLERRNAGERPALSRRWTGQLHVENLFCGLPPACDFVDLVQNGFCTRPVAPLQGSLERRSCTLTTVSRHRIHPPNRF